LHPEARLQANKGLGICLPCGTTRQCCLRCTRTNSGALTSFRRVLLARLRLDVFKWLPLGYRPLPGRCVRRSHASLHKDGGEQSLSEPRSKSVSWAMPSDNQCLSDGTALFFDREPPTLEQSYRDAHAYLLKYHGKPDPTWGSVNRHKRGDIDLPI
jgi:hypothetical protein